MCAQNSDTDACTNSAAQQRSRESKRQAMLEELSPLVMDVLGAVV